MARKPTALYNVHRQQDGAQIISGVPLKMARSECARLNAEAQVLDPDKRDDQGRPVHVGMYLGELVRYEVRSVDGLVIA